MSWFNEDKMSPKFLHETEKQCAILHPTISKVKIEQVSIKHNLDNLSNTITWQKIEKQVINSLQFVITHQLWLSLPTIILFSLLFHSETSLFVVKLPHYNILQGLAKENNTNSLQISLVVSLLDILFFR